MNEIEQVRQLQRDCLRLHIIPPILPLIKVEKITNTSTKVIEDRKSNSFVRNAYNQIVCTLMSGAFVSQSEIPNTYDYGGLTLKTTTGFNVRTSTMIYPMYIFIGSGSTPDTLNDYVLQSRVTSMSSAGIVRHGSYDNTSKTMTITLEESYVNTTATTYNISECGVFGGYSSPLADGVMILRDTFTSVSVAQHEGIKITYNLEMVFP